MLSFTFDGFHSAGGLASVILPVLWPFLIIVPLYREYRKNPLSRGLLVVSGLLILVGGESFFAPSLLISHVIKPSGSFQWPAGYVKGIARTPGGLYVVPLTTPGRVQLYDPNWHFLRGWQVDSYGKDFKVACNSGGIIDVFTRAQRSFFNEAGEKLPDEESALGPVNLPPETASGWFQPRHSSCHFRAHCLRGCYLSSAGRASPFIRDRLDE
jgi:hypothetical protein